MLCCLMIISYIIGTVPVSASNDNAAVTKALIDGIIVFEETKSDAASLQEWLDGELTQNAGSTSEWYVMGLSQLETGCDFTAYADALSAYLSENSIAGAVVRQRYALTLISAGYANDAFVASVLEDSIGAQGIMSWVFGLHLINNGFTGGGISAADAVEAVLALRLADGGWALTGTVSDVDVTAMTLQALAPYYASDDGVRAAVDGALVLLSERQLANGGFSSYATENPESSAQVIIALSSLGLDCQSDARFIKNDLNPLDAMLAFRLPGGGYAHTADGDYNHTATVQAFCSLVSLWRFQNGLEAFYMLDEKTSFNPTESPLVEKNKPGSYKLWAYPAAAAAVVLSAAVVLRIVKKRRH